MTAQREPGLSPVPDHTSGRSVSGLGPPTEAERLARVALNRLAEPGDVRLTTLVAELGATLVLDHLAGERDDSEVATDVASRIAGIDPTAELERAAKLGLRFIVPGDEEWPPGLDDLAQAPPLHERGGVPIGLWVRGPLRLHQATDAVAVVGARSATSYGEDAAREIGAVLAGERWCVTSGAAFGIDQAAHRGALSVGGPSIAVLACGADRSYPAAHQRLLQHLAEHGAVASEAAPGCAPTRVRFLARNRLIAALARGTVVVEAAIRSGALNTANWTERLHRPLMAVPGPVTSATSQGCHHVMRSGAAGLVSNGAEVLEVVARAGDHLAPIVRGRSDERDGLSIRQRQVLDAVPVSSGARADAIARAAGVGLVEVQRTLLTLARSEFVAHEADGWRLGAAGRE